MTQNLSHFVNIFDIRIIQNKMKFHPMENLLEFLSINKITKGQFIFDSVLSCGFFRSTVYQPISAVSKRRKKLPLSRDYFNAQTNA